MKNGYFANDIRFFAQHILQLHFVFFHGAVLSLQTEILKSHSAVRSIQSDDSAQINFWTCIPLNLNDKSGGLCLSGICSFLAL